MKNKYTKDQKKKLAEYTFIKRLITEVYPRGIASLVSDTFNLWEVLDPSDGILLALKDKIMARDGKVVIRPDSGNPVDIICGTEIKDFTDKASSFENAKEWALDEVHEEETNLAGHGECGNCDATYQFSYEGKYYEIKVSLEWNRHDKQYYYLETTTIDSCTEFELSTQHKGVVQCLWEIFGGTVTSAGFKALDEHIGAIYGDSITLQRAEEISERLSKKGFASTNVVFGIGSFTYQGAITPQCIVTRDSFGMAVKGTYVELTDDEGNIESREIFKDPITDNGLKKSAKGLLAVTRIKGDVSDDDNVILPRFELKDQATWEEVNNCAFETLWEDGKFVTRNNFADVKQRVANGRFIESLAPKK